MSNTTDKTNPSYYRELGNYSALHVIRKWKLGYSLGQTLKYIQRAGRKNTKETEIDLKKAIWYILSHLHEINPDDNPDPADEELRGKAWYAP